MTDIYEIWRKEEEIHTTVDANGYCVWNLHYDSDAKTFELELDSRLDDDEAESLCGQMTMRTEYIGEGGRGSCFTMANI